ncbi:RNase adapter RapZ [Tabrizicola sp. J26]|uniref:RNase adapter RapZ n=1 Tax=Alitabrizicola rongguiensis TaxID=2909234 RepID=UPI001F34BC2B|nr:RNase adapter RapZ [Tabrizicola rongguiensis]MCF1708029.1 RNase adapter RapZ [Tabrizicola rongguiensis]
MDGQQETGTGQRLVLVTGPSGAGRSTAIHALEDMGYEVIDNLPLSLVPRLIDGPPLARPVALGLDVRNRDFNVTALIELIDSLSRDARVTAEVLYLDCAADELVRRFNQTKRRHPLAPAETAAQGVEREVDLLAPIRVRADHLVDTTEMSPHDLKAEIGRWFGRAPKGRMAVSVQSFSYKRGLPRGVDMIFDCRFLRNPYWAPDLRDLDGRNGLVAAHIAADPKFDPYFDKLIDLIKLLLPAHVEEGKSHLTIAFGCTGGQHRSVAVAEKLGKVLSEAGWPVAIRHRELERRAVATPGKDLG